MRRTTSRRRRPPHFKEIPSLHWSSTFEDYVVYPDTRPVGGHSADTIRPILLDMIADARATKTLNWSEGKIRSYTNRAIYLAEWLKNGEGDRLLAEFKTEIDRLAPPFDQVATKWREMWGLGG